MKEIRDRYEIFLKVCETGSFSKAAEALNYTQSGISQMMAGFEEELGVQLFARAKKGVTLTDNGRMLMPYIQEMTNQKDKLRQAAFNINHKIEGKLRIGSFSSVTAMWMPEVIHYFNRNYPQVEVQIFDGNYDEIRDWIIHGQVDCGFLSSIVADNLKFYPLCEDPLCAVMLVMKAFANDVESRPLEPGRSRIIGLAFVKTMNSVVTKILLEYLKGMM